MKPSRFSKATLRRLIILRRDATAGLVVALVALPLCIGIAIASDLPPSAGLLGGIIGGLVVPIVSRSPLGISAPAAGLIVLVSNAVHELSPSEFTLSVVIAGATQLILGLLRGHTISHFIPTPVIYGMLAGIGGIVLLKQAPQVLGVIQTSVSEGLTAPLPFGKGTIYIGAALIGLFSLAVLICWETFPLLKKIGKWLPGPLIAVLLSVGLALAFSVLFPALNLPASMSVSLPDGGMQLHFTPLSWESNIPLASFKHGVLIGIVAAVETLLSAEAISKLDPLGRPTPKRRELFAQGVGNITAGLIGAMPIAQVIIRSSTAIQAGGYSRFTAFFDGFFLSIFSFLLASQLKYIPLASIGAVLTFVGYKLIRPAIFRRFYERGFTSQFLPFILTLLGVVFIDLLSGVLMGLALSVFISLWKSYGHKSLLTLTGENDGRYILYISGNLTFLHKEQLLRQLSRVPPQAYLNIDLRELKYADADVSDILADFQREAARKKISITILPPQQKTDK
ncbi:MAG: SulP family inorganic anion transporter [Bacteroidia bacterium]|nr:SulP family inorganic anion transporter [Bacteroidia bacterium]